MFGTTTFMFISGIIALVLEITMVLVEMQPFPASDLGAVYSLLTSYYYVWGTFTRLMVRCHDAFIPSF
jgi:hypothetical protein